MGHRIEVSALVGQDKSPDKLQVGIPPWNLLSKCRLAHYKFALGDRVHKVEASALAGQCKLRVGKVDPPWIVLHRCRLASVHTGRMVEASVLAGQGKFPDK